MQTIIDWLLNREPQWLIAQGIGVLAAFFGVFSFQQRKRSRLIIFQTVASLFWIANQLLLGAMAGMLLNVVAMVRAIVFSLQENHRWARNPIWLFVFIAASAVASAWAIWHGDGYIALLPFTAMVFSTVALRMKAPFHIRIFSLFCSPCWLPYNIINQSVVGVVTETINMVSIISAMIRIDILGRCRPTEKFSETAREGNGKDLQ